MKAIPGVFLSGALILLSAGVVLGQDAKPSASGSTSSSTSAAGDIVTPGPVDASGQTQAAMTTEAETNGKASLMSIRERATKASTKACAAIQKDLAEISKRIDADAETKGSAMVAGRIAPEFGMTVDAMAAEQSRFGTGLGQLTIAHTLMANSKAAVTMDQLFQLRDDGMGWGQIAYGLNLRMSEVTAAVKSEGNVAAGLAKADGKPAMIHSATTIAASQNAGVHAGPASVGTASNVGVGLRVGN